MLHGHMHSEQGEAAPGSYNTRMQNEGTLHYDVGVDANAMTPISLGEILAWFQGRDPEVPQGL